MGAVVDAENLATNLRRIKKTGKKIVLCHGCFDLMHPGHIKHFQAAKQMGDVLVVTITPDAYVDKGPGRPVFNQELRVNSVAALSCVDFAVVNKWPTAEETLIMLRPDIYVKGQEFEKGRDKTGKLQREWAVAEEIGCQMCFTHEIVFSSTRLLNTYSKDLIGSYNGTVGERQDTAAE